MADRILLVKAHDGSFRPVTTVDMEALKRFKVGSPVNVTVTKAKDRSLKHHRLYWGGLIPLALEYWEPTGGLISYGERKTLKMFARWLDAKGGNTGAIRRACKAFLTELSASRAERIPAPEKSAAMLHRWVKEQAGYYTVAITPTGIIKELDSISFDRMDQDEFNEFYKAAFSVVWRFVLSRHFESESDAQIAIERLSSLG